MRRFGICSSVVLASILAVVTFGGVGIGDAATVQGGNAGGGAFATLANKQTMQGTPGSGLTRGITATSIKVGCVYTAEDYAGFGSGLQAAFALANKKGIDGRKISLVPCDDDGGSQQTDVEQTQQLVSQDDVFAMMYVTQSAYASTTNFLDTNQVPFFGWGTAPGWCGTRWGFGWNGCLIPSLLPASNKLSNVITSSNVTAMVNASGIPPKKIRFAVLSQQNPTGIEGNASYVNVIKAIGGKTVFDKASLPVQTAGIDFTPYAQQIVASKPNLVMFSTEYPPVGGLKSALTAAGYKGASMDFTAYQPGLLATNPQLASALQGEYVNTQTPPQEGNSVWTKQAQAALKAVGQPNTLSLGASMGYNEGTELVQMLQAVGKNLNTKTFDKTVNGGKFVSFKTTAPQGSPGALIWPAAHFIPANCAAIVQVSGTSYKIGSKFQCYPSYSISPSS